MTEYSFGKISIANLQTIKRLALYVIVFKLAAVSSKPVFYRKNAYAHSHWTHSSRIFNAMLQAMRCVHMAKLIRKQI